MTDAAREARREYRREWGRKHPEKIREYNRKFWERKAAQLEEQKTQERREDLPQE